MGPYHPALLQPFAVTVKLRGEMMTAVSPLDTGYCARDIETLVRGKPVTQALALVERSCALAGHTHRTAACQAIERALHVSPSRSARLIRSAFAEIERILARLWTLGVCSRAAGLDTLWRTALEQRETLFVALYQVSGQRSFWSVAVPGGVRPFNPPLDRDVLRATVARLEPAMVRWRRATSANGSLSRAAAGAGILGEARARALAVTGIVARGAGLGGDLRRDPPDAPEDVYDTVADAWPAERIAPAAGDAAARLSVAADDLITSVRLARGLLEAARDAGDTPDVLDVAARAAQQGEAADGIAGSAAREGPHGPVTVAVSLAPDGTVDHMRLRTPGAGVVAALPEVLRGQPLGRAPLIVASLDLCVECLDL